MKGSLMLALVAPLAASGCQDGKDVGSTCHAPSDCTAGTLCTGVSPRGVEQGEGTCRTVCAIERVHCSDGSVCVSVDGAPVGVCWAPMGGVATGETCAGTLDCAAGLLFVQRTVADDARCETACPLIGNDRCPLGSVCTALSSGQGFCDPVADGGVVEDGGTNMSDGS